VPVYGYYVFPNPPYRASRQLLIPRIAAVGIAFSPLPCQAWHGYGVASAHRVEVEVGADGPASASLSGAAAAAPPAGASEIQLMSVPGVELVGEQHQGRALTSEPLRRQATSPGGSS
jgi:hypothetical protein